MFEIIPGILEKDWDEIERKILEVKDFSQRIHIDLIDGKFANNTTFFDPRPFSKYTNDLFFEVHLMVEDPIKYIKDFSQAGFKRFLGHIEKMPSQEEFVALGQLLGEVGLALDSKSTLDDIKVDLNDLDLILVMTVKAGSSGQKFMPSLVNKINKIKRRTDIPVEADGGINDKTIVLSRDSGANYFVSSSFIFNSSSPKTAYDFLRNKLSIMDPINCTVTLD